MQQCSDVGYCRENLKSLEFKVLNVKVQEAVDRFMPGRHGE